MTPETTASKLLAYLGVYGAMLGTRAKYRGPTPERKVMGRNGTKRAGAYGKGLRNWANREAEQAMHKRLNNRMEARTS